MAIIVDTLVELLSPRLDQGTMTLALTQLGFEDLDIDWPVVSSIGNRVPGFGQ